MVGPVLAGPACLSAQKKEITAMFSSEQQKSFERKTYRIPACLSTEDKLIVLGPLSLTLRQAFILTLFGCLTVDLWRVSAILPAWGGIWVHHSSALGGSARGDKGLSLQVLDLCWPSSRCPGGIWKYGGLS